jgi:hypothetical protein
VVAGVIDGIEALAIALRSDIVVHRIATMIKITLTGKSNR